MHRNAILLIALFLLLGSPALAGGISTQNLLSPQQEVTGGGADPFVPAPVASESQGFAKARVDFDRRFSSVRVDLQYDRLDGEVTRLHFHCAIAGENGPIALGLIDTVNADFDNSDVVTLDEDAQTISGRLTLDDFPETDACADAIGQPINNLVALSRAIDDGLIYLNLHTDAWPAGEVRAQGPF